MMRLTSEQGGHATLIHSFAMLIDQLILGHLARSLGAVGAVKLTLNP